MSKTALALILFIPCAILAVPAWLVMRAFNEWSAQRRARQEEADSARWDAEIAKVRQEMKR